MADYTQEELFYVLTDYINICEPELKRISETLGRGTDSKTLTTEQMDSFYKGCEMITKLYVACSFQKDMLENIRVDVSPSAINDLNTVWGMLFVLKPMADAVLKKRGNNNDEN